MLIFILIMILISICMILPNENNILKELNIPELTVYTNFYTENSKLSGNGYSLLCSIDDYLNFEGEINGISFETNLMPTNIINRLKLKTITTQNIVQENDKEIIYCFTNKIKEYVVIDNKKVNFQIVFDGEKSIIGIPLILGSY